MPELGDPSAMEMSAGPMNVAKKKKTNTRKQNHAQEADCICNSKGTKVPGKLKAELLQSSPLNKIAN